MKRIAWVLMVAASEVSASISSHNWNDGTEDSGEWLGGPGAIALIAGAAMGYFIERAYNKARMDKANIRYSKEHLGGKCGAIVGAIALPLAIAIFR